MIYGPEEKLTSFFSKGVKDLFNEINNFYSFKDDTINLKEIKKIAQEIFYEILASQNFDIKLQDFGGPENPNLQTEKYVYLDEHLTRFNRELQNWIRLKSRQNLQSLLRSFEEAKEILEILKKDIPSVEQLRLEMNKLKGRLV